MVFPIALHKPPPHQLTLPRLLHGRPGQRRRQQRPPRHGG
eukprot:CAMPEP_0206363466 /NCGR_PEP_ID=MMETSP0294-20121207/1610_1 /ASSEMBLY_ACC=CAM_ASM_000327 /TAXON_ID=39354 /ORGANISM="Heterosigma akashiwo, Strain CCMP2393" /LENGTH=39 /DNA_ID= /DNA_START= /DNA_END= /DNA_ORIENTATION=